jgi:hypothetical protein
MEADMTDQTTQHDIRDRFDFGLAELSLQAEELESLDALEWSWGDFFGGVAVGLGVAGMVAGGIGVGLAIT